MEVFDASRYARHIALSRGVYCSDKGLGYALGMDAVLEAIRLSKESDAQRDGHRRGGYEPWYFFPKLVFLLLARESVKGNGGASVEEKGHVLQSLEG